MRTFPVRKMTQCAFFAALTAVCAWIGVPLGDTVFTMQTFAVFLTLGLLGLVGVPVFSAFRGGIGTLLGPTGGYLWGFLFAGLCFRAVEKYGKLPAMLLGQLVCYACGTLWYGTYTGAGWQLAAAQTVLPYLIPDAVKLALARQLTEKLKRYL